MLKFRGPVGVSWDAPPFIAKIVSGTTIPSHGFALCRQLALPLNAGLQQQRQLFALYQNGLYIRDLMLGAQFFYLADGDLVKVSPIKGVAKTMYRRQANCNVIFTTERCNSNCLMCSQPPRDVDDSFLLNDYLQAIPLMDPATKELGMSGGEPTLLGEGFLTLIQTCRTFLPNTGLHILTNGKSFADIAKCRALSEMTHPDLMLGIPLYSDIASRHDFVVQSAGAFNKTVRGLLNLSRYGIPTEIRVVVHAQTYARLPELGRFIAQNLPFVKQVAFMGLEMMGYVKMNFEGLWVDPADYQTQLRAAIGFVREAGIKSMIYNHQLCTLPADLWPYSRKSISDWKNEYTKGCQDCSEKKSCGGFFSSTKLRHSRLVSPIQDNRTSVQATL